MKELFQLFWVFVKIGAVTFGGGYAMLPILQREIVEKRNWATEAELLDYYAIGQCTPGVIAVNVATFVGFKKQGILGGIFSTLGVISPSILMITLITACLENFAEYKVVQHALSGIRVCVCVLIFQSVSKMWKKAVVDKTALLLFLITLALAVFSPLPVALLVIAAGFAGWSIQKAKGEE
ncbi:MAG: chromate transporter [Ruminococcaceae bacterium]|nr:chromate transporter [Oscillospiraceae bacterium]